MPTPRTDRGRHALRPAKHSRPARTHKPLLATALAALAALVATGILIDQHVGAADTEATAASAVRPPTLRAPSTTPIPPPTRSPVISRSLGRVTSVEADQFEQRLRTAITAAEKQAAQKKARIAARKAAERRAARIAALKAAAQARAEAAARAAAASTDPGTIRDMARHEMLDFGFAADQWPYLDQLVTRESNWNPHAMNASSGAYGLPQALPGSKMATEGADWHDNPVTQIRWMLNYIAERYGDPAGAWAHSQSTGWY